EMFAKAAKTAIAVSWFSELAERKLATRGTKVDVYLGYAIEQLCKELTRLGAIGQKFEREMRSFLGQIESEDHDEFSRSLKSLGELLGFTADQPPGKAMPDCVWSLNDRQMVSEAKIQETPEDAVSVATCRETAGHLKWAQANRSDFKRTDAVLVTKRKTLDKHAEPHAGDIYYV